MKHKILASIMLLASILIANPTSAQPEEINRLELYNLCSKFPFNSRCKGLETSAPLDELIGEKAGCLFQTGNNKQGGKCKVVATEESLTVYLEEKELTQFLDDQLPTVVIKIPVENVFAQSHQIWNKVHRLEFSYLVEPNSDQDNRTKFLSILTKKNSANSIISQLNLPPTSIELISEIKASTMEKTIESGTNPSKQVQQLLETRECVQCDLRSANLVGQYLNSVNLEGANLQGANLQGAKLGGAYLVGTNLNQANLKTAYLSGANLTFASLQESVLEDAILNAVNLKGANLQQANLQRIQLIAPALIQDADLRNANLMNANIQGANFERANLEGVDLEGADLSDISVSLERIPGNYNLGEFLLDTLFVLGGNSPISKRGVKFYTNLRDVNLRNANLSGVKLEDALLEGADLSDANLSGAKLSDVDLSGANMCGATMSDGSISNQGC